MPDLVTMLDSAGGLPGYEVPDTELGGGASLGNGRCWAMVGSGGRLKSLFSTDVGRVVAGPLVLRYAAAGFAEGAPSGCKGDAVPLPQVGGGTYVLGPASQRHRFRLPGRMAVTETIFLPMIGDAPPERHVAGTVLVELVNEGDRPQDLAVYAFAGFQVGGFKTEIRVRHDPDLGGLAVAYEGEPDWLGVLTVDPEPTRHGITADVAMACDTDALPRLEGESGKGRGDLLACTENRLRLGPGDSATLTFVLAFWHEGDLLREALPAMRDGPAILDRTLAAWRERLDVCEVSTPDPVINAGGAWAKVNMVRVLAHYPKGLTFTNDPGRSSNVVTRDVIWFTYGCDHFWPEASREMLTRLGETQYEDGKVPEYYNARTGERDDYGLNINDGTALYVLGVNHHARSTGDMGWLAGVYDRVAKACRYILTQRDERGLVYANSDEVAERGIVSWRNVIREYQISGAVTEINAECAAALRAMGHMAENIGRDEEGAFFTEASEELAQALNKHLLDRRRRLYLLNIDPQGRKHTDVTADEIFPVLFRVVDEETAYRIIRRLNSPDFWTEAGLRTASRLDPLYDPAQHVGLIGGVWPGLTWWYAFAAARYHPEFMVRALHASFSHYARHPRAYNTVPGQFSEWFDGESLISRGMPLSPWEPPRFLWAAVEGVGGLMVLPGDPRINPLLPKDWKWTATRHVRYHDRRVSIFSARMQGELRCFGDLEFESDGPREVFDEEVTDCVRLETPGMHPLALRQGDRTLLALGSCREESRSSPVGLERLLEADATYRVREWASEQDRWSDWREAAGRNLEVLAVRIEAQGFHLVEFQRKGDA